MRSRIMSRLAAAAAAGATATTLGFAAAGAASAATAAPARAHGTTLPTMATTSAAGYEASGRDFRYISSTLTVPDTSFLTGLYPQEYIQLSNGSLNERRAVTVTSTCGPGIESCTVAQSFGAICTTGTWVSFVEAFDNSLSGPYFAHYSQLSGVTQGDGVNFSIYFDQGGNELHFTITPPSTSGPEQFYKTRAFGPLYDHAAAVDDFTDSTGHADRAAAVHPHSFRINQFLQGALTTYSGARGFLRGPVGDHWGHRHQQRPAAAAGTTRVSPTQLWSDGLAANGTVRPFDAFGVWAR